MAMRKSEYSKATGILLRTFACYINGLYLDEMKVMDYSNNQKVNAPANTIFKRKSVRSFNLQLRFLLSTFNFCSRKFVSLW